MTCDVDNLLLTENQRSVKLADFGLAREESVTEMMTAETGTYRWMAPEVFFFELFVNEIKCITHNIAIRKIKVLGLIFGISLLLLCCKNFMHL